MSLELPKAFTERMQKLIGDEMPDFLHALDQKPKVSIRINPDKPCDGFPGMRPVPWCDGAYFLAERPFFFKDPKIYAGAYYVQEASSMLIAQALQFEPGQRILDLCAAPGGKSTLLASRMQEGSLLISNEIVRARAEVLEENLSRWGNENCLVTHNHPKTLGSLRHFFDAMVIDAPCSGEGMFRKDPKVISHWSPKMVQQCADRQKEILESVIHALVPDGLLVYSTCTYNREENEEIVQWLLEYDGGMFEVEEREFPQEWGLVPGSTDGFDESLKYTYHCYPHHFEGEGFYFACLRKVKSGKSSQDGSRGKGKPQHRKGPAQGAQRLTKNEIPLVTPWLANARDYVLFRRGDAIEAIPNAWADDYQMLAGELNLLKAGVRLGELKGNKFIPDHDFAQSGLVSEQVPRIELDLEQAMRYLSRDELQLQVTGMKDWALAVYEGFNLGWMKVLEGRVNNHLPKHLRIRTSLDYSEFE